MEDRVEEEADEEGPSKWDVVVPEDRMVVAEAVEDRDSLPLNSANRRAMPADLLLRVDPAWSRAPADLARDLPCPNNKARVVPPAEDNPEAHLPPRPPSNSPPRHSHPLPPKSKRI